MLNPFRQLQQQTVQFFKSLDRTMPVSTIDRRGQLQSTVRRITPSTPPSRRVPIGSELLMRLGNTAPLAWAAIRTIREFLTQCEWDIVPDTDDIKTELTRWQQFATTNINPYDVVAEFETNIVPDEWQERIRNDLADIGLPDDDLERERARKRIIFLFDSYERLIDQSVSSHVEVVDSLFRKPNNDSEMSWRALIERVTSDLLIYDAGVIVENWSRDGSQLAELYDLPGYEIRRWINPDRSTPQPPYAAYEWWHEGRPVPDARWANDELVYMMANPQIDGYGYSPLEVVRHLAASSLDTDRFNIEMIREHNVPPTIVHLGNVSPMERTQFEAKLDERTIVGGGLFKTVVMSGADAKDFKVQQLKSVLPAEMQLDKWDRRNAAIICMVYGLSPQDIGLVLDFKYQTAERQYQMSQVRGVQAYATLIASYVNAEIVKTCWDFDDVKFMWRGMEGKVDEKQQADIDWGDLRIGVLNRNDIREKRGKPPIEGGDVNTIDTGMGIVPVDRLAQYKREQAEVREPGFPGVPGEEAGPMGPTAPPGGPVPGSEKVPMVADTFVGIETDTIYPEIANPFAELNRVTAEGDIEKAQVFWSRRQTEIQRCLDENDLDGAQKKVDILRYNLRKAAELSREQEPTPEVQTGRELIQGLIAYTEDMRRKILDSLDEGLFNKEPRKE